LAKAYPILDVPFSLILKNAMGNSDQAPLDGSNGSGSDHNTPPKLLGSEDKHAVVNLMTPSSQPITPVVILDLTSPEQKLTQPLVTTSEKDTEADKAKADTSKSKANEDYLPPLSSKRKDPPDLHAKIPRKKQKVDKALLENKTVPDDPLSRIYPSIPIVPLDGLPNKKVQDEDTEDLSLTEELFKERLFNRKEENQRLSHIELLEDDAREEEKDTHKQPPPGKSESPRLSTSGWHKKQKLLLKKKAATKKQAAIAALALAVVKLSEANTEGNESEEPSNTESENVEDTVDSKAARRSAKIEALERLVEEKKRANIAKEMEMLRLVETPVTSGPPKNQQAITHFFA
jgi:hypothetical protein